MALIMVLANFRNGLAAYICGKNQWCIVQEKLWLFKLEILCHFFLKYSCIMVMDFKERSNILLKDP